MHKRHKRRAKERAERNLTPLDCTQCYVKIDFHRLRVRATRPSCRAATKNTFPHIRAHIGAHMRRQIIAIDSRGHGLSAVCMRRSLVADCEYSKNTRSYVCGRRMANAQTVLIFMRLERPPNSSDVLDRSPREHRSSANQTNTFRPVSPTNHTPHTPIRTHSSFIATQIANLECLNMVYESDFYTTRRPYSSRPVVSSYTVTVRTTFNILTQPNIQQTKQTRIFHHTRP